LTTARVRRRPFRPHLVPGGIDEAEAPVLKGEHGSVAEHARA
jgi:hypothetical protein